MGVIYSLICFAMFFLMQFIICKKSRKRICKFTLPIILLFSLIFIIILYTGGISVGSGSDSVIAENKYFAKTIAYLTVSGGVGCLLGSIIIKRK